MCELGCFDFVFGVVFIKIVWNEDCVIVFKVWCSVGFVEYFGVDLFNIDFYMVGYVVVD